jgi:3-phenylpropionate/cinnamic acid dioxygenase small subunit
MIKLQASGSAAFDVARHPLFRPHTPTREETTMSEEQSGTVQDEREIVALATRYTWAVDDRDWSTFRNCFTDDATGDYSRVCDNADAIVTMARAALDHLTVTQHTVSNFEVTVDGDNAEHRCYINALHVLDGPDGPVSYTIIGRYVDRVVRTAEGWRLAHRRLEYRWSTGDRSILTAPSSGAAAR